MTNFVNAVEVFNEGKQAEIQMEASSTVTRDDKIQVMTSSDNHC